MSNNRSLRPSRGAAILAAAAAATTVLAACGASTADSAASQYGTAITPIVAKTITGTATTVPTAGKANVMIFYSVGCGTCVGITQHLASIAPSHTNTDFLAINMDQTEDVRTSKGFLDYINSPQIVGVNDSSGDITRAFAVSSVSTIVVTNPDGQVVLRGVDPKPDQINAAIQAATT